ncbi:hypothetical protein HYH03_001097 [Edaphochlamys debaryana]|uniref:Uncharacterized protein n=1 Tax=Edaphochlamys debaryana TaxID=47281 RepID=A0A836C718_9CHLO|nr:hypothetical protein HYH03_001097 [Edaphochlamys debaryana]|eukprot:KAG2501297.1 hypothetical protein HYH03_001097 [Edaphochlamys debaryana]
MPPLTLHLRRRLRGGQAEAPAAPDACGSDAAAAERAPQQQAGTSADDAVEPTSGRNASCVLRKRCAVELVALLLDLVLLNALLQRRLAEGRMCAPSGGGPASALQDLPLRPAASAADAALAAFPCGGGRWAVAAALVRLLLRPWARLAVYDIGNVLSLAVHAVRLCVMLAAPRAYFASGLRDGLSVASTLAQLGGSLAAALLAPAAALGVGSTACLGGATGHRAALFYAARGLTVQQLPSRVQALLAPVAWLLFLLNALALNRRLLPPGDPLRSPLALAALALRLLLCVAVVPYIGCAVWERYWQRLAAGAGGGGRRQRGSGEAGAEQAAAAAADLKGDVPWRGGLRHRTRPQPQQLATSSAESSGGWALEESAPCVFTAPPAAGPEHPPPRGETAAPARAEAAAGGQGSGGPRPSAPYPPAATAPPPAEAMAGDGGGAGAPSAAAAARPAGRPSALYRSPRENVTLALKLTAPIPRPGQATTAAVTAPSPSSSSAALPAGPSQAQRGSDSGSADTSQWSCAPPASPSQFTPRSLGPTSILSAPDASGPYPPTPSSVPTPPDFAASVGGGGGSRESSNSGAVRSGRGGGYSGSIASRSGGGGLSSGGGGGSRGLSSGSGCGHWDAAGFEAAARAVLTTLEAAVREAEGAAAAGGTLPPAVTAVCVPGCVQLILQLQMQREGPRRGHARRASRLLAAGEGELADWDPSSVGDWERAEAALAALIQQAEEAGEQAEAEEAVAEAEGEEDEALQLEESGAGGLVWPPAVPLSPGPEAPEEALPVALLCLLEAGAVPAAGAGSRLRVVVVGPAGRVAADVTAPEAVEATEAEGYVGVRLLLRPSALSAQGPGVAVAHVLAEAEAGPEETAEAEQGAEAAASEGLADGPGPHHGCRRLLASLPVLVLPGEAAAEVRGLYGSVLRHVLGSDDGVEVRTTTAAAGGAAAAQAAAAGATAAAASVVARLDALLSSPQPPSVQELLQPSSAAASLEALPPSQALHVACAAYDTGLYDFAYDMGALLMDRYEPALEGGAAADPGPSSPQRRRWSSGCAAGLRISPPPAVVRGLVGPDMAAFLTGRRPGACLGLISGRNEGGSQGEGPAPQANKAVPPAVPSPPRPPAPPSPADPSTSAASLTASNYPYGGSSTTYCSSRTSGLGRPATFGESVAEAHAKTDMEVEVEEGCESESEAILQRLSAPAGAPSATPLAEGTGMGERAGGVEAAPSKPTAATASGSGLRRRFTGPGTAQAGGAQAGLRTDPAAGGNGEDTFAAFRQRRVRKVQMLGLAVRVVLQVGLVARALTEAERSPGSVAAAGLLVLPSVAALAAALEPFEDSKGTRALEPAIIAFYLPHAAGHSAAACGMVLPAPLSWLFGGAPGVRLALALPRSARCSMLSPVALGLHALWAALFTPLPPVHHVLVSAAFSACMAPGLLAVGGGARLAWFCAACHVVLGGAASAALDRCARSAWVRQMSTTQPPGWAVVAAGRETAPPQVCWGAGSGYRMGADGAANLPDAASSSRTPGGAVPGTAGGGDAAHVPYAAHRRPGVRRLQLLGLGMRSVLHVGVFLRTLALLRSAPAAPVAEVGQYEKDQLRGAVVTAGLVAAASAAALAAAVVWRRRPLEPLILAAHAAAGAALAAGAWGVRLPAPLSSWLLGGAPSGRALALALPPCVANSLTSPAAMALHALWAALFSPLPPPQQALASAAFAAGALLTWHGGGGGGGGGFMAALAYVAFAWLVAAAREAAARAAWAAAFRRRSGAATPAAD